MKFVLMLTVFGYGGPDMQYVVNHDMTGVACVQQLEEQQLLLEKTFDRVDFELSCELDNSPNQ